MTASAQVFTFPATRHQTFPTLSGAVVRMVERQVREMRHRLLTIAATEYGHGIESGMREDLAMERADDLLCSLIDAAEQKRHELLAEVSFLGKPNP
jgi:hypothetical protein